MKEKLFEDMALHITKLNDEVGELKDIQEI